MQRSEGGISESCRRPRRSNPEIVVFQTDFEGPVLVLRSVQRGMGTRKAEYLLFSLIAFDFFFLVTGLL